eukprot:TRINITY_DN5439_c0_g1_i3.p1 TRINITY_DN5439_c0_g1~~TRINITY_DN5439_c0_g1_i3.p1  ORF type:complete len:479 (-),score=83.66 TRINITY_DN5439_c0_g1_i3:16-1452(-)
MKESLRISKIILKKHERSNKREAVLQNKEKNDEELYLRHLLFLMKKEILQEEMERRRIEEEKKRRKQSWIANWVTLMQGFFIFQEIKEKLKVLKQEREARVKRMMGIFTIQFAYKNYLRKQRMNKEERYLVEILRVFRMNANIFGNALHRRAEDTVGSFMKFCVTPMKMGAAITSFVAKIRKIQHRFREKVETTEARLQVLSEHWDKQVIRMTRELREAEKKMKGSRKSKLISNEPAVNVPERVKMQYLKRYLEEKSKEHLKATIKYLRDVAELEKTYQGPKLKFFEAFKPAEPDPSSPSKFARSKKRLNTRLDSVGRLSLSTSDPPPNNTTANTTAVPNKLGVMTGGKAKELAALTSPPKRNSMMPPPGSSNSKNNAVTNKKESKAIEQGFTVLELEEQKSLEMAESKGENSDSTQLISLIKPVLRYLPTMTKMRQMILEANEAVKQGKPPSQTSLTSSQLKQQMMQKFRPSSISFA